MDLKELLSRDIKTLTNEELQFIASFTQRLQEFLKTEGIENA